MTLKEIQDSSTLELVEAGENGGGLYKISPPIRLCTTKSLSGCFFKDETVYADMVTTNISTGEISSFGITRSPDTLLPKEYFIH